jgi:uncharacterized protein YeaO (DUF488 family)
LFKNKNATALAAAFLLAHLFNAVYFQRGRTNQNRGESMANNAVLYTGCIFDAALFKDFRRVSVMSRHTLNDGKTPDQRIVCKNVFDIHLPILAPSLKLVGARKRKEISWKEFEKRYIEELQNDSEKSFFVAFLANLVMEKRVILLCAEKLPIHCHRRILAKEILRIQPSLTIKHRWLL